MTLRLALFAVMAAASPAAAQAPAAPPVAGHHGMQHGAMPGMGGAQMSANHMEMMRGMERMTRDMMAAPMTGNPDRDLATMMIPHHQGAIDMARIYLRDGKDPDMRRIAEKIVTDQEREIREFRDWLAKNPAR
ncbi:MAG: DUF305 domain-containing protein [Gemmatimonadaceae bacterium]|nr:DUF305 domain-containing protein [Acetobacteraceae bacterium]